MNDKRETYDDFLHLFDPFLFYDRDSKHVVHVVVIIFLFFLYHFNILGQILVGATDSPLFIFPAI